MINVSTDVWFLTPSLTPKCLLVIWVFLGSNSFSSFSVVVFWRECEGGLFLSLSLSLSRSFMLLKTIYFAHLTLPYFTPRLICFRYNFFVYDRVFFFFSGQTDIIVPL